MIWPNTYTALAVMGMILHQVIPTSEQRAKLDGSVYTWGDYAENVSI